MIKELLGAASALALFAGVAAAQDAATTTPTTPPGATPTPPAEATMPTPPPATAAAPADAAPAGMPPTEQAVAPEPAAPPAATPVPAPVETAAPMPEPATPPPAAEPATSPAAPAVETAAPEPAPEPAPAATAAAAAGSAGKPVSADDMMGRQVEGTDGQPIGRISDVLVDPASGQIQRLVIASGGFLGLGAKNVALEFDKVEVRPEGGIVATGVTREAIEGMPEYDVAAETAPLDARPEPPATTGAAGGIATPGMGAGGAVAPAPGQTAQ